MTSRHVLRAPLRMIRRLDRAIARRSDRRRILVDSRTPVNYTMVAPVVRAMAADARVEFFFTASEEPARLQEIYREAPPETRLVHPNRAALMRFDAYVASDFMWQTLPRGGCRIQVFHGVAGKYGFDAPTRHMRPWDRIFFINRRRLRNYVTSGAIEANSPAIRLVGMPKADAVVDGTYSRDAVARELGLDPALPVVLYAPTWSPASSLNSIGVELVRRLMELPINVVVKLHDRSRDPRPRYSGGVDWIAALQPLLSRNRGVLAPRHDISPYLVAADLMITDHSSAGFEYLLRDRPLVRIHRPELIREANIHTEYVELRAAASTSASGVDDAIAGVERGLAEPSANSATRRAIAQDLFYSPGSATRRSVEALYEAIELDPVAAAEALFESPEASCQRSA
ncbi:MAG TPA: CDP-glycerol glycerophosphotransferase family protein [Vicinamibacterales bacterium]|nr:CDP-glycerol glycerophosphotransferase family protein [Vicinamibacterales bacterium]